jgi:cyanate lyase
MIRHNKKLAELINKQIKLIGMSQAELGRRMGYKNSQFIYNFLSKHQTFPVSRVKRLAEVTGLDPAGIKMAMVEDYVDCLNKEINGGGNA